MTDRRRTRWLTMQDARVALVVVGIAIMAIGGVVLLGDVAPRQYPAIALWLVGALVVHDGILAGIVFAAGLMLRRTVGQRSFALLIAAQVVLAVGGIVALVVLPEVVAKAAGRRANPSILPSDYGINLIVYAGVLVVVAAAAVILHVVLARRIRAAVPARR